MHTKYVVRFFKNLENCDEMRFTQNTTNKNKYILTVFKERNFTQKSNCLVKMVCPNMSGLGNTY